MRAMDCAIVFSGGFIESPDCQDYRKPVRLCSEKVLVQVLDGKQLLMRTIKTIQRTVKIWLVALPAL